jgi:hypothetical protein
LGEELMAAGMYTIQEEDGQLVLRGGQTNALVLTIDPVTKTMRIVTRHGGQREEHVLSVYVPVEIAYNKDVTLPAAAIESPEPVTIASSAS